MKKTISIVTLSLGIILLIIGLSLNPTHKKNEKIINNEEKNIDKKDLKRVVLIPITKYSSNLEEEIMISNFEVKNNESKVLFSFNLTNQTNNIIEDKNLYLNFYNGEDIDILFNYNIQQFEQNDTITIESEIEKNYNITKYTFQIDDFETEITPFIDK